MCDYITISKEHNIYVVLSRDDSEFVYITTDQELSVIVKNNKIDEEEYAGGRPSVYILITHLEK